MVAPAVLPFDTGFRKSNPFTGTGTASKPAFGAGAVAQTIAVAFSGATDFTVVGSSTAAAAFTIGALSGSATDVTYAGLTFRVSQGATAFASGDRFCFEAHPTAAAYTVDVPFDVSLELVGRTTGGAETLTVGNAPLAWGRQTVFERTAVGAAGTLGAASRVMDRLVVTDNGAAGLAVGDRAVIDDGLPTEEYVQVGRVQTISDTPPNADLGSGDRIHFTTGLRFAHAAAASIRRATLTARREGVHYTVSNPATGELSFVAGAFAADAPVVVSYRTSARQGAHGEGAVDEGRVRDGRGLPRQALRRHARGQGVQRHAGRSPRLRRLPRNSTAWQVPTERAHPEQSVPVRTWTNGCNGCHDSDAAAAHMALETSAGVEACATCHGPGREFSVEDSHMVD